MADRPPSAFMSYAHFDDNHEDRRITELLERLSGEVRMQTGKDFPIFQDIKDIKWGQEWEGRIEQSLDEVTFLIPIITPVFFNSKGCRDELQIFIEREKEQKRNDLILPIYYVNTPLLNTEEGRESDELAKVIAARQFADWRDLRLEPLTLPQVGKALVKLALQIRDALERVSTETENPSKLPTVKKPRRARSRTPKESPDSAGETSTHGGTAELQAVIEMAEATQGPSSKSEPPTRVVDPMHRGDHVTISEAIKAANPGDRILVRPGFYQEGLVIDKPLEIIGDGNIDEIVVQVQKVNAILFRTTLGRFANLTLRQLASVEKIFCVVIAHG
ncbi:MAG: TIR domain-containing protein, partial [Chloroflexi bacterium]|nr:TIR domain-containing protein [Chloroflexota bacterium]